MIAEAVARVANTEVQVRLDGGAPSGRPHRAEPVAGCNRATGVHRDRRKVEIRGLEPPVLRPRGNREPG